MATGKEAEIIPSSVMESTAKTLNNIEELKAHLLNFIEMAEPDALAEMPPLGRAHAFLTLAQAVSTLFTVRLRCSGVNPNQHPVKTELDRLCLYEDKLERFKEQDREPLQPSTFINRQAATRFIEHALPDLNPDQKKSMRSISSGELEGGTGHRSGKKGDNKRKRQRPNKKSLMKAAQEFLEKAKRELLRGQESDMKGPLNNAVSDGEDTPTG